GMPARALSATATPLLADKRQPESVVVTLIDQTDRILNTQRLHHAATHDQLTGLANRLLLRDRVGRALAAGTAEKPARVAVLFIALNRFKRINEGLGDRMGDEVLRITAQRLMAGCRAGDVVARWGADEFVVVLDGIEDKAEIVGTATRIVDVLSREITLDGVQLSCSCSVGIAVVPDDGDEADELFSKADAAMHRAKSRAGASYEFYSGEPGRWTRDRLALERELRQGMARGEFELHYQPKIRIGDESLVGFEALMRWRRPDGELMPPGVFIGLAEESGLIVELGAWALREAIAELGRWRAAGCRPVPVAVNVSGRQLQDHGIVETIREALAAHAIAPSLLTLEITENTAMADPELASALTAELAEMGVRVSIDDFGTGYSSLSLLRRVSIAEVKIDRSFVEGMIASPDDAAIVRATIALAHELGLQVVAEGVELRRQLAFLAEHDCDTVQGFLFGRAVPGGAACRMLAGDEQVQVPT
ncbi:MAG TPA: bifunctional diguanylate cyclase/phosphodiesterase, partial [Burkholderiaceae bacterium]|nr:bifunctional diguanylate cyclase/phosphodiesterase [Burkholderiaceae bacterium]